MEKALPCAPGPTVASGMGVRGSHCGRPGPKAHRQAGHKAGRPRSLHSPVAPNCPTGGRCLLPPGPWSGEREKGRENRRWPTFVAFLPLGQPLEAPERKGARVDPPVSRPVSIPSPCHCPGVTAEICPHVHTPQPTRRRGSGLWAQAPLPWEGPHWLPALPSLGAAARPSPKAPGFPGVLGG